MVPRKASWYLKFVIIKWICNKWHKIPYRILFKSKFPGNVNKWKINSKYSNFAYFLLCKTQHSPRYMINITRYDEYVKSSNNTKCCTQKTSCDPRAQPLRCYASTRLRKLYESLRHSLLLPFNFFSYTKGILKKPICITKYLLEA